MRLKNCKPTGIDVNSLMDKLKTLFAFFLLFSLSFTGLLRSEPRRHTAPADLLITGGTIVTMDASHRVIENGAVAIQGTRSSRLGLPPT